MATYKLSFTADKIDELLLKIDELEIEDGADGKSAYEIAVENGFRGTEQEWLNSLHGKDGKDGAAGKDGADGHTPVKGEDYWTPADQQSIVDDVLAELAERETKSIDMSNWANNSFTETYVNGDSATRSVTFDDDNRPVSIENPDGGSVTIEW